MLNILNLIWRIAIVLGIIFLFGIIDREYMLGTFLMIAAARVCYLLKKLQPNPLYIALDILYLIISALGVPFAAALFFDDIFVFDTQDDLWGLAVYLAAILIY